ncbi:FkbM family methyltransferase [Kitasatospora kifunensis]|uniref:FkbM family methyltransferase n=1 Tax=Kitasatospora kifunensis TaxID=58351 RepID=A0A7W7VSG0_KITKI|nr:FkbM family methyltransferase [Kitasatospora kifunensis]MBB4921102.1 FkbM family methyltransferase [Kitasatospora kifunensis]
MNDSSTHPGGQLPRPDGRRRHSGVRITCVALVLRWAAERWPFVDREAAGLRPLVRPGAVCLDLGAEYGLYTWSLSAIAGPGGRVHSVEPLYRPARWLTVVSALLGCRNVTVHRTALGDRTRSGTMSLPRRRTPPVDGCTHLTEGALDPGPDVDFLAARPAATPVRTVDDLCRQAGLEKVDFIKAEVDGGEAAALFGAFDTLLRDRPALLLGIEDRRPAKDGKASANLVHSLTITLGYTMYRWQGPSWEPVAEVTDDCRNYLFTTRPLPLPGRA